MERPAGLIDRFFANIIDATITGVIFGLITLALYGEFYVKDLNITDFISLGYLIILPVIWRGYVIGKRIMNVRIVNVTGEQVTIVTMLLRVLVAGLIYFLTLGSALIISAFMVGLRNDKRAIHDFIARTQVVYDKG